MFKIGPRLRAVREAEGLSLEYLANRLGVVHTTILMYEKSDDLKHGRLLRLAEALEVQPTYLTGQAPDLERLGEARVVRRESLRLFLEADGIRTQDCRKYERILEHPLAPVTVAKWRELNELIQGFWGARRAANGFLKDPTTLRGLFRYVRST